MSRLDEVADVVPAWLPSAKVLAGALGAGLLEAAASGAIDWRTALVAFGSGFLAYFTSDVNPAASSRRQALRQDSST